MIPIVMASVTEGNAFVLRRKTDIVPPPANGDVMEKVHTVAADDDFDVEDEELEEPIVESDDADFEGEPDDVPFDEEDIDLDELGDDDEVLVDDDDDALVDDVVEDEEDVVVEVVRPKAEDEDEDDIELDPDDVEASLDDILKDRLVIEEVEIEDDEELPDTDNRDSESSVVIPKRPDEFVCQSCFLVKHPSQLADKARTLCRDCV
jgi:hypothetical protein